MMTDTEFLRANHLINPALSEHYKYARGFLSKERNSPEEMDLIKEYREAQKYYYKVFSSWRAWESKDKYEYDDFVRYFPEAKDYYMPCDCAGR